MSILTKLLSQAGGRHTKESFWRVNMCMKFYCGIEDAKKFMWERSGWTNGTVETEGEAEYD